VVSGKVVRNDGKFAAVEVLSHDFYTRPALSLPPSTLHLIASSG
jgi:hypothetical protein